MQQNRAAIIHKQRYVRLHAAACIVREHSMGQNGDYADWRLSRLMRDAGTEKQLVFGEQEYGVWLNEKSCWIATH
jgi:hypothetical protein